MAKQVVASADEQGAISPYHNAPYVSDTDHVVPVPMEEVEDEDVLHDEHDAGNQVVPMDLDEENRGFKTPERPRAENEVPDAPVKEKQTRVSRKLDFE